RATASASASNAPRRTRHRRPAETARGSARQSLPYAAPSPACGGGPGWGPHQLAALDDSASDIAPIPAFPRKRGKELVRGEKVEITPPPPRSGEGWGGGRIRSPRPTVSRRTLPPSQP